MADYHDLGLRRAARQVCEALSEYVTVLEERPGEPPEVVAGMEVVRQACAAFVECSIDTTGWGNPFAPVNESEEDDEEPSSLLPGDKGQVVEFNIRYLIRCPDPWIAGQYVRQRLRERGVPITDEVDYMEGILEELHNLDAWRPHRYTHDSKQVFELIQMAWQAQRQS